MPLGSASCEVAILLAESVAFARLGYTSDGADCYTTLRPCFGCLKELHQGGIARVRYLNAWTPKPVPLREAYDGLLGQLAERGVEVQELSLDAELLDLRGAV